MRLVTAAPEGFRAVASLSFHVGHALKWADRCVEDMLMRPVEWLNCNLFTTGIRHVGHNVLGEHGYFALKGEVLITGKIDDEDRTAEIRAVFLGKEDLNDPRAVYLPDDMRGPRKLFLAYVDIKLTDKAGKIRSEKFEGRKIRGYHRPDFEVPADSEDAAA